MPTRISKNPESNTNWKIGKRIFKCQRCNYEWRANIDNQVMASGLDRPAKCPGCKSLLWWIPIKERQKDAKRKSKSA